jgi:DNA polymerase III epsilon subunit-like protein
MREAQPPNSTIPIVSTTSNHLQIHPSNSAKMVTKLPKPSQKYREDMAKLARARSLAASRSKVFIAIDVEWDETNPSAILEIGIAVLDLRKGRLHPDRFPPNTWSIRPRHFIISENREVHNGKYARSNKFGFKFGKSYHCKEQKAVQVLQDLFDWYMGEVVLVGHCMTQDLQRLQVMGVALREEMVIDTGSLERAFSGRVNEQRRSLGDICEDLDIKYFAARKLHNAGNDAFFTMAVFAHMCCVAEDEGWDWVF